VIGIAAAVVVGFGIYTGGVRLDLSRFFTGTGVFLVFVAGGLVLTVLRRAHEAGWIVIGQQRTVDLSWLAPNGSVQGALVTGVLGIPPDPRVIEVLGWFLYVVPVLALTLWPRAWRPSPDRVPRVRAVVAGALAVAAAALAIAVPTGGVDLPRTSAVSGDASSVSASVDGASGVLRVSGTGREARITLPTSAHRRVTRAGVAADRWRVVQDGAGEQEGNTEQDGNTEQGSGADRPSTLTLDDLVTLFGRLPVGVSPSTNPGPFAARWAVRDTVTLWTVRGGVLDATRDEREVLTLSGGGLPSARTTTLDRTVWSVPDARVERSAASVAAADARSADLLLWKAWLPIALGIAAAAQALLALRDRRRRRLPTTSTPEPVPARGPPAADPARSTDHVLR
jgi:high-affinity iron transporter